MLAQCMCTKHSILSADLTLQLPVCKLCAVAAESTMEWRLNPSDRLWPEDDRAKPDRLEPYPQWPQGKPAWDVGHFNLD